MLFQLLGQFLRRFRSHHRNVPDASQQKAVGGEVALGSEDGFLGRKVGPARRTFSLKSACPEVRVPLLLLMVFLAVVASWSFFGHMRRKVARWERVVKTASGMGLGFRSTVEGGSEITSGGAA